MNRAPMRLELTLAGLQVKLASHYSTRGAQEWRSILEYIYERDV